MALGSVLALLAAAADAPVTEPRDPIAASTSGYYYLVPSGGDSLIAIGSVEMGRVHLEGRYGYEDSRTASVFGGHRFDVWRGDRFELSVTPILGGVVGRTTGGAAGVELEARLWRFELSSESEYVLVGSRADASFFYTWNELVFRPIPQVFAGAVGQRTRFVHESPEVDLGALIGCNIGRFTAKAYAFRPTTADRFFAFALQADL